MALPVRGRNIYVVPFRQPVIEKIVSQTGADKAFLPGDMLILIGRQMRGDVTLVRVGGIEVKPALVSDTEISLALESPPFPADSLRAGLHGVQVLHQTLMGTPPVPHRGVESNVAAFVLRPAITAVSVSNVQGSGTAPRSADVTFQVNPLVGKAQRVILLLNELADVAPVAYTFVAPSRDVDANSITISISGVKAGEYLVRLQVDGAESPLDLDPASPGFGPKVTIP